MSDTETRTDELRIVGVHADGTPRVERKTVTRTHSSTVGSHKRLPPECATLVDDVPTPVADLSPDEREFVDEIDDSPAINRKGFEVLSHFYKIDVHADIHVPPEDTGFEFARVKATATRPDGRECEAFGTAHVDRGDGDDPTLLLEMAETRAKKRALSIATGVGACAVEELRNEVEQ